MESQCNIYAKATILYLFFGAKTGQLKHYFHQGRHFVLVFGAKTEQLGQHFHQGRHFGSCFWSQNCTVRAKFSPRPPFCFFGATTGQLEQHFHNNLVYFKTLNSHNVCAI